MGFDIQFNISAGTAFLQGLVSFFSPCVLPLVPVYIGYLSGGTLRKDNSGNYSLNRKVTVINTLFFVTGISAALLVLGAGALSVGSILQSYRSVLMCVSGALILFFGLYQMGIFSGAAFLSNEVRLPFSMNRLLKQGMSPIGALFFGFVFSFAWTPCVGPALAGVLLMTANAQTRGQGLLLLTAYTCGFAIPFILTGIFSVTLLDVFRRHLRVVRWTVKAGGIIFIFVGAIMLFQGIRTTGNRESAEDASAAAEEEIAMNETDAAGKTEGSTERSDPDQLLKAIDFIQAPTK